MPNVRNLPAKVGPYLLLLIPYIHSQIVSEDMLVGSLCKQEVESKEQHQHQGYAEGIVV